MPKTPTAEPAAKKTTPPAHKAAAERPHKGLTQTQEEIADLASDILLNGGRREDLIPMLSGLLRHQRRRRSYTGPREYRSAEKAEQEVADYADSYKDQWYRDLAKLWPEKKVEVEDDSAGPTAVKAMVQADLRRWLRGHFEQFLTDTNGLEPIWLLNEVLEYVESTSGDLAEAFAQAIGSADTYVRVPVEHKKRIEEYVEFLTKEKSD
jgi:hypothetical protein